MKEELYQTDQNTEIYTNDLNYAGPGNNYCYSFSYFGNGIFILRSIGYADELSIKKQIQSGNIARERLASSFPGIPFHLIWDVSELKGASIFARYQMMLKAGNNGTFGSITAVGANNLSKSFVRIISTLIPNLKLYICKSEKEAISNIINSKIKNTLQINNFTVATDTEAYSRFIDLWQQHPDFYEINGTRYKILHLENWSYTASDNNFKSKYYVLEGNIILCDCEGIIREINIEKTYQMLEDVMHKMAFDNNQNKYYTVVNHKKIRGITLNARKLTNHYEELYKDRAYMVILLPSQILNFALKIQKKINPNSFRHWTICANLEEAFDIIDSHKKGIFSSDKLLNNNSFIPQELILPKSQAGLTELVKQQHQEIQILKKEQYENIERILEITARMTWDETFGDKLEFKSDTKSPFSEVFNALSIVHEDFQEIVKEINLHVQMLKESEDKYRNMINLANDIITVYQDNTFKLANSRAYHVLGYTLDEIQKMSAQDFLTPSEYENVKLAYYSKKDISPWYIETALLHKNGDEIPVSVSVGKITYENYPAEMLIIRDITAKRKAEEELEKHRNHLEELVIERTQQLEKSILEREVAEESDRLKSAFLSNMSHEIRTPMNAIIAFSTFLKNPDLTNNQRDEYISYIQSSGQSLLNLIHDIIDISKIEAKQIRIQHANCSINPILEELFVLFKETIVKKGCLGLDIKLEKKYGYPNLILKTDPYRLKQILSNLLDNALKFTTKGTIEFGFELIEKKIIFFVKDTGVGIPKDKTEYIFQRFGKIEGHGRNLGGTGLGLAISQNLATLLNGKLYVESILGEGSTFFLELPFLGDQEIPFVSKPKDNIVKSNYIWPNKSILVAEDEDLNFKVIEIALRNTQAEIIRAKNGIEAIEAINSNSHIDLILMDIQMPEMNGYEALSIIKQQNPGIVIIAQTAFALVEEKEHCISLGFNDYISKPLNIKELISKIDFHLSSQNI